MFKGKRRYRHETENLSRNNIKSPLSPFKKRKAGCFKPSNFKLSSPVEKRNIICLCPDGSVKNMTYITKRKETSSLGRLANLKALSEQMKENKVEKFNIFIDSLGKKNKKIKTLNFDFGKLKEPFPQEVLKPIEFSSKVSHSSDLMYEEVNWNKRYIEEGNTNYRSFKFL